MPRFVHPKTEHAIETAIPREAAELRSQGYREQKQELFDPSEKTVDEVLQHLDNPETDWEEINRVVVAEREGKARKTILNWTPPEGTGVDVPESPLETTDDAAGV